MEKRRFLYGVAATLCGVSLLFRGCGHLTAHAAEVVQLTPGQTRALFGDTLTGSYYNTNTGDYEACTFTYLGTTYVGGRSPMRDTYGETMDRIAPTGSALLIYQSDFQGLTTERPYYSVRFSPLINLGMLQRFSMVAGFSAMAVQHPEDPEDPDSPLIWDCNVENCAENRGGFPENYWSLLKNGNRVGDHSADAWTTGSNILDWLHWGIAYTSQSNRRFFIPNIIDVTDSSYFSVSDLQITRQGYAKAIDSPNGRTLLYMTCPILTQDYTDNNDGGEVGTDLTATNLKLDTIIEILSRIANDSQEEDDGSEPENDAPTFDAPASADVAVNDAMEYGVGVLDTVSLDGSGAAGVLGIVWRFIQRAHLDAIFLPLCLLMLLRWFIFKRG